MLFFLAENANLLIKVMTYWTTVMFLKVKTATLYKTMTIRTKYNYVKKYT